MSKGLKAALIVAASAAVILVAVAGGFLLYANNVVKKYDVIYPGVKAAGVDLSGMTREQAEKAIQEKTVADFGSQSFTLVYEDCRLPVTAGEAGIAYDAKAMSKEAFDTERDGFFLERFFRLYDKKAESEVEAVITRSTDIVEPKVKQFASLINTDATDPSYEIRADSIRVDVGVEGRVLEFHGRTYVVVGLLGSWFARASVPRAWLEKIDKKPDIN